MSKITENLYLGDLGSLQQCDKLEIDVVVTILEFKPKMHKICPPTQHIYFNAEDDDDFNISIYFDEFIKIMEENKDKKILVHCYAGVSRSASLVASWIIYDLITTIKNSHKSERIKNKMIERTTVEHTLKLMKKKRPRVDPNNGFIKQLEIFRTKCIDNLKQTVTNIEKQNK